MDVVEKIRAGYYTTKINYTRENRTEYNSDVCRLLELFKHEALDELNLLNHPKAKKAWDMAWDRGHSNGLYAVWEELEELSDLLV